MLTKSFGETIWSKKKGFGGLGRKHNIIRLNQLSALQHEKWFIKTYNLL